MCSPRQTASDRLLGVGFGSGLRRAYTRGQAPLCYWNTYSIGRPNDAWWRWAAANESLGISLQNLYVSVRDTFVSLLILHVVRALDLWR